MFRKTSRMPTKEIHPTRLELTILRALWRMESGTVREIHEVLDKEKPIGFTTVLKMIQIMTEKGLVERAGSSRPQVYRPKHSQSQTQRHMLSDLVERAFGGSVKALVLEALASTKSSKKDLEIMEKLLEKSEGGDK
jgi:predicted transcriptional regulator